MTLRAYVLAIAAGLGLADASIVTLALPDILRDLDTSVEGVAAVIGVYTVVLAIALIPFERAASALSVRAVGAGGFLLFAVASAACAGADDLTGLLVARCAQAIGAAAGLATVFDLLGGAGPGRRLWLGAAVFATALGPAVGGALTEAFDWRAIFVFQVPVAAAGAIAVLVGPAHAPAPPAPERPERFALRPALALALVSAALAAVLFLLVLLLVAGWNVSPLSAAVAVTVIPLAALAGARLPGDPRTRAAAGCALVGGGVLALAWLPGANLWWTVIPQVLAGVGMGLALTALGGDLLPERTPRDAVRLLAVRHAGIAAILAIAAPIAAHQLDVATQTAKERGVALVLDAPLAPQAKIKLAPTLLDGVDSGEPRAGLRRAVASQRSAFSGRDRATYDSLGQRADDMLVAAVGEAFRSSFLLAGAAGLLAAALLVAGTQLAVMAVAGALTIGTPAAYLALHLAIAPEPPAILDPCTAKRTLPKTGGVSGFLQDEALRLLDSAACKAGSSREELVLALADKDEAKRFQREHGVDPRTAAGVLQLLLK
ncbi:MAG: MFS transporter [Solirubrobacteraceae bacterium]